MCEAEADDEVAAVEGVLEVRDAGVLEGVPGMLGCPAPPLCGGCRLGSWSSPLPPGAKQSLIRILYDE